MIQIGYLEQFKGARTVLIAATTESFTHVYHVLTAPLAVPTDILAALLQLGRATRLVNIEHLAFIPHSATTRLHIDGRRVTWEFTDEYRERLLGLLDALNRSDRPAHQFLHTGTSDAQFVLSKGEYIDPL